MRQMIIVEREPRIMCLAVSIVELRSLGRLKARSSFVSLFHYAS